MSNKIEIGLLMDEDVQADIASELASAISSFLKNRYAGSYPTGSESVGKGVVVAPTKLTLDKTTLELTLGQDAQQLTPKFEPAETTDQSITWTTSNDKVAKVDETGKVTPVAAGTATITATSKANTKLTATCAVTVKGKAVTGVTIDPAAATVAPGGTVQLKAVIAPTDASNQEVTWTSNNPNVTVSTAGLVTVSSSATAGQTATITAKTKDGDKTATCVVTVGGVKVTGITLDKSTLTLTAGGTDKLTATVAPANAADKSVTWTSSKPDIVTVDENGNLRAIAAGEATITAESKDGGYKATCAVTVKAAAVSVTGVSVAPGTLTLGVGETGSLTATVSPTGATNKNVTWSSSDSSIATVKASGEVTAVSAGTATITATTEDGSFKATCTVTVKTANTPVTGVSLPGNLNLAVGGSGSLTATVSPTGATNKGVTWSSSKPDVVTVDENGNLQAVAAGTATITATTVDGGFTATCVVTVE